MACSRKQALLIDKLQLRGALIEENDYGNPDFSYLDSVEKADAYIKKWGHLMSRHYSTGTTVSAQDWGGIPNH